jgi:type I restriction enzyme S subunit
MSQYPTYKLGDILSYEQPTNYIVESTEYDDSYPTPVLTAGKSFILGYTNETKGVYDKLPVIIFDDFTTASQFVDFKFKVKSSAMKILSCNEEIADIKYMYYLMQITHIQSDTHKRYWISDYSKIPVSLPPLPTQHAIVSRIEALFAELDKAVQHLRTAQQQLKTYRQAVLNHWLTNGSENWEHTTIGNIVEKVEYGSSAKSEKEGKVPVLRMGNIQKGRFDWSDLVYSNNDEEINKYLLKKDDVLFNRTNSPELVGKTAIYKGERPAIFAGYLIRLHYKKDLINADFLNYYLNSDIARNYGNTVKSDGVNQSNINGQKLKTYPFALPPLSEQQRIVAEIESRLSQTEAVETSIERALQQSEALRQSILKKAFNGELI